MAVAGYVFFVLSEGNKWQCQFPIKKVSLEPALLSVEIGGQNCLSTKGIKELVFISLLTEVEQAGLNTYRVQKKRKKETQCHTAPATAVRSVAQLVGLQAQLS